MCLEREACKSSHTLKDNLLWLVPVFLGGSIHWIWIRMQSKYAGSICANEPLSLIMFFFRESACQITCCLKVPTAVCQRGNQTCVSNQNIHCIKNLVMEIMVPTVKASYWLVSKSIVWRLVLWLSIFHLTETHVTWNWQ